MDMIVSVVTILAAIAVGAVSPGPSFVFVARTAMATSRRDGLAAALGMGLGAVFFCILVLFGLQAILATAPWLFVTLKLCGGVYLGYLAFRIWRGAKEPLDIPAEGPRRSRAVWKSGALGLGTQISNPKTAVVYGGVFAALLPQESPRWVLLALPPAIFLIEAGWYALVALLLSSSSPRAAYLRAKTAIDRTAAGILGFLGVKLLSNTLENP